ncbi:DUF4260 family protein [Glaciihabitans sp. dw_435]|uniref:DUF4260 family protein n=1 Tax=Glaciihabitans sp. dw_435 TaxID=2720081 RepID=UPI001BD4275B|nr:DUF4260 family protein [Glaciihabitans sp. dw_435]
MTDFSAPAEKHRGVAPFTPVSPIYRAEGAAIAIATVVLFVLTGFSWWWLLALFLAFDLSFIGYAVNNRAGALGYNLIHNYVAPTVLVAVYGILVAAGVSAWPLAFIAGCWFFHVAADRAMGFGPRPSE